MSGVESHIVEAAPSTRVEPPTGTQAIERALSVLHCFLGTERELGITEIARRLALTPSTVHRMVRTFAAAGYLEQNPSTERYHLGRAAVLLGQVAQRASGLDRVQHIMEELAEQTGESVNFVVLENGEGVVTLHVDTKHPLRFEQPVGTRVGMHSSASGKAILAFHPDGKAALARLGPLTRHTDHTITTRKALERELREIRARGFSLDEQEAQLGVRCIAFPVLDRSGHADAAIALQIPTVRIPRSKLPELAPVVRDAAARASGLLRE